MVIISNGHSLTGVKKLIAVNTFDTTFLLFGFVWQPFCYEKHNNRYPTTMIAHMLFVVHGLGLFHH